MRILVINPNSSPTITERIREMLLGIKRVDTELDVICLSEAPATLESSYDEAFAIPLLIDAIKKANKEGYDAVVLACFCDAGLEAAKEVSDILVLGLEETTLAMALLLGHKFSIMTERREKVPVKETHVRKKGLESRFASVRPIGLSVADLAAQPERVRSEGLSLAQQMIEEDGAEVIIMGCAAMSGYADEMEKKLNVPVLDPVAVTFKVAEAMVDLGLRHSKVGLFATPPRE
jgi:allantoin racemase